MLRAGFAGTDITPDRSCSLMGYEFRATDLAPGNDGVNDPLAARVLVLDDGTKPAVLASVDLCLVPTELARRLRAAMARKIGTTADRVVLAATHTHSGPMPLTRSLARTWDTMRHEKVGPGPEIAYGRLLEERLLDATARAAALTFPVNVSACQAPLGLGYDRRVVSHGSVAHCWGPQEYPDLDPPPSPDPTCALLLLTQVGGPRRYVVWNTGFHPVVLGKTSRVVSADYPGRACAMIDESLPGAHSMFLLGAAGNSHPWVATQDDASGVELVARAASSFVALLSQGAVHPADRTTACLSTAVRSLRLGRHTLDLAVWRVGAATVVTAPVELFGVLGRSIRERIGGTVLVTTVANGWSGYCPDRQSFEEGGYEVANARETGGFKKGDGERLADTLVELSVGLG